MFFLLSLSLSVLRNPRLKNRNENTARINRRRKRSMKRRERKKRERGKLVRSLIHLRPLQRNQKTSMNQQSRSWRKRRSRWDTRSSSTPSPIPTKSVYETPPSHPPPHPVCDSHMNIPLCACNFSSRRFLSPVFSVSVLIHVCVSACHHNVQSSCRKRLS